MAVTLTSISPGSSASSDLNNTSNSRLSPAGTVIDSGAELSNSPASTCIVTCSENILGFSTVHSMITFLVTEPESISPSSSHVIITSGSNCAETGVMEFSIVAKISIVQTTLTTLDIIQRGRQLRIELFPRYYNNSLNYYSKDS